MPSDDVSIDIEGLRSLIGHMNDAHNALQPNGSTLFDYLDGLGLPTDYAKTLLAAAMWSDDQVPMLDRRLSLAEGIDTNDIGLVTPASDSLTDFSTRAQAEQAGRGLARRMRDGDGNPDMSAEELEELVAHRDDPDYVSGFYAELGPQGLALLVGDTDNYPEGYDPAWAQRVLGSSFATYTRTNPTAIDNGWLGRFNHVNNDLYPRDEEARTSFESNLMALLLPYGAYGGEFLTLLGDRVYGDNLGDVRDTGWGDTFGRDGHPPGVGVTDLDTTPLGYQASLLEAIANDPTIASSFAEHHLDAILADSRDAATRYQPDSEHPVRIAETRLENARAELVRAGALAPTVGGARLPDAALPGVTTDAQTLVAHLAFLQHADGGHVSTPMEQAYGDILHTYTNDMYRSVVTLVPDTAALYDAKNGGVVGAWPGAADLWTDANAGTPGIEIPKELWAALLDEALRNGNTLGVLASDAQAAFNNLGPLTEANNRNPGTANESDNTDQERPGQPSIDYYRSGLVQSFFGAGLATAIAGVQGEIAEWRRQASANAAGLSNTLGEIPKGFSPGKKVDLAATVIKISVELAKTWARGSAANQSVPQDLQNALDALRAEQPSTDDWAKQWRKDAETMWNERSFNPIEPTRARDASGAERWFTGDPVHDGFVSARGAPEDFMTPDGKLVPVETMSAAQRAAYERWLISPAVAANNLDGRSIFEGESGGG